MDTANVQIQTLFTQDVQYIIPLFQRHYVWDREDQWEPLWKDIQKMAEQRMSEHQREQFTHFTGAIVIQLKQTNVDEVKKYEIIDGQQRLTTFQVIFCAIRDICKLYNLKKIEDGSERYILNPGPFFSDLPNEQYKLIPTQFDIDSFISLADRRIDNSSGQIRLTYDYFKNKIEDYVNRDKDRMNALYHSILNDFGFVQILVDQNDEPERIFESLNARAKPLLQFDLLRNNLFLRAEEARDRLYREYWEDFETDYWDTEIKSVKLSEQFLQHFLMANLGMAKVKPEFNFYQRVYRREAEDRLKIEDEFAELNRYAQVYQRITNRRDKSEIGQRMRFYHIFGLTTLHPFILFLKCGMRLSDKELNFVFDILESYTIRRMLCCGGKGSLKRYNISFSEIIESLKDSFGLEKFIQHLYKGASNLANKYPTDSEVEPALHPRYDEYLFTPEDTDIGFPNDQSVESALNGFWVETAGPIQKRLIRYILYRIEVMKGNENDADRGSPTFNEQLSLEHIMPIKWKTTWTLPIGEGVIIIEKHAGGNHKALVNRGASIEECLYKNLFSDTDSGNVSVEDLADKSYLDAFKLSLVRDRLLQSIGNLTLVKVKLNASMSNKPFCEKRERLYKKSQLILNREIHENNDWDINEIHARAGKLIADVCKIWPSLDWFAENLP